MDIFNLLKITTNKKASDLHIKVGAPPMIRVNAILQEVHDVKLTPEDTEEYTRALLDDERFEKLQEEGELDFAYSLPRVGRFRVNAYKQRNTFGIALRRVNFDIPTLNSLNIPEVVTSLTDLTHGLVLVTGPTGSGKSTTLASMIQSINEKRKCHIMTLEDPIEYLYKNDKAVIGQREVGVDTKSFSKGLRAALRQDPDIILVGEMRDLETVEIALLAAETGHLVLSTLHTLGSAKTIDRVIDAFPSHSKEQIKVQLASVLQAVISQQLLQNKSGFGIIPACEVMLVNSGIRNLIRESKTHQVQNAIVMGMNQGMITMDNSLKDLYHKGMISRESALNHSLDRDEMIKTIDL